MPMLLSLIFSFFAFSGSHNTSKIEPKQTLATHTISLDDRYANASVNGVFKDNILLTLAYLDQSVKDPKHIDWIEVEQPGSFHISLKPQQTFTFHDDVLPSYKNKDITTTNAHFSLQEGFKTDGYLAGDGVCHLASLMYWTAKDAGLDAKAPTPHDFAVIPEIPTKDGVAIYYSPDNQTTSEQQNLYITNNLQKDIAFDFVYKNSKLTASITE